MIVYMVVVAEEKNEDNNRQGGKGEEGEDGEEGWMDDERLRIDCESLLQVRPCFGAFLLLLLDLQYLAPASVPNWWDVGKEREARRSFEQKYRP